MKFLLLTLLTLIPLSTLAASADELYQVIAFQWDSTKQKLIPTGFGSGTSVHGIGLITNKHVVEANGKTADFILLCKANRRRTKNSQCTIPASVTATHPDYDVAIIHPLNKKPLYPEAAIKRSSLSAGDPLRIYGFPYSPEKGEFGDNKAYNNFETFGTDQWKNSSLGDKLTITRGTIQLVGVSTATGEDIIYLTDAKVDHGSSGGGAFDRTGKYFGIPTYKIAEDYSGVIAFSPLESWAKEQSKQKTKISSEILNYYKSQTEQKPKSTSSRKLTTSRKSRYIRQISQKEEVAEVQPKRTSPRRSIPSRRSYTRSTTTPAQTTEPNTLETPPGQLSSRVSSLRQRFSQNYKPRKRRESSGSVKYFGAP